MPDNLKEKILHKIPNEPCKTMGLHSVIRIAVYLPYDITANVSVTDGMTNGVECRIMKIDYRVTGSQQPSILWVLFPDQSIGSECRREYAHLYNGQIESTCTPLLEITKQFSITRNANFRILRRQFPLRPASAKTIHRSQGDTLESLVIDFPRSTREHMHYVGLSRVTSLANLHIVSLNEQKITASKKVGDEMRRLRESARLQLCIPALYSTQMEHVLKIVFANVRSLHLHFNPNPYGLFSSYHLWGGVLSTPPPL